MSDKSKRAYYWINAKANGLSKWIDSNHGRLLLIAIFAWLGVWGLFLEGRDDLDTARRLIRGMGPELAGIVIAAVTIDALAERRLEQERKVQLIRQLGSKYRDVTEMAVIELRHKGWLKDGSLNKAFLLGTNLNEAYLGGANLNEANLGGADLSRASLAEANLSRAKLGGANLSTAILWGADLSGADLGQVKLDGAFLWKADLNGADMALATLNEARLWEANLSMANLGLATLSEADLRSTNLSGANLGGANLSEAFLAGADMSGARLGGAKYWTIKQLEQAKSLRGAIMPDKVQLGQKETKGWKLVEGPTFEEWKARYLSEHGGNVTDIRDRKDEPDHGN